MWPWLNPAVRATQKAGKNMGGILQFLFGAGLYHLAFTEKGNLLALGAGKRFLAICDECERAILKKINTPKKVEEVENERVTLRVDSEETGSRIVEGRGHPEVQMQTPHERCEENILPEQDDCEIG